jgi:hypothetical protein
MGYQRCSSLCSNVCAQPIDKASTSENFIQPLQFFDEHGQEYTVEPTDPQFEFYLERMKTQARVKE